MNTDKNTSIFLLLELKKTKGNFCGNCAYQGKFHYKKICRMFNKEIKKDRKTMEYIRCKGCRRSELK